jgi:membrane protease YdiL (CAAX protease family)
VTEIDDPAMLEDQFQPSDPASSPAIVPPTVSSPGTGAALLQVAVATGVPTQLLVASVLAAFGMRAGTSANPVPSFFAAVALIDTLVLLALIRLFLRAGGEQPRAVLLGTRPAREVVLGLTLFPVLFLGLLTVIGVLAAVFPSLHTAPVNPYEMFFHSRIDVAVFAVVGVVAGGVREEVQRGFILHRFRQRLGGGTVGLAVWSLAFGLGHYPQGWDVALGMMGAGAFWGWLYLRRGSVVAPMVNHAVFDLVQVVKIAFMRSVGA